MGQFDNILLRGVYRSNSYGSAYLFLFTQKRQNEAQTAKAFRNRRVLPLFYAPNTKKNRNKLLTIKNGQWISVKGKWDGKVLHVKEIYVHTPIYRKKKVLQQPLNEKIRKTY